MTPEDKQLLLQDLCARVPYHPKGHVVNTCNGAQCDEWLTCATFTMFTSVTINCRLYLRPMSSMTDEEFTKLKEYSELKYDQLDLASFQNGTYKCLDFYLNEVPADVVVLVFDWLNKNHFNYRGLIERGLAIEITNIVNNE